MYCLSLGFFVQRSLEEELKRLVKFLTKVANLLNNWYQERCANRLQEMLMEHLLQCSPVLSLEHILKLQEGVHPGEVASLCPFVKLGDHLINLMLYLLLPLPLWILTQRLFWELLLCNL